MKKIWEFIKEHRDIIYIILLIIFGLIISKQCSKIDNLDSEIVKHTNNEIAMTEELNNYKDELGRANAEKHAYQLTQDELLDSIDVLKKKNYEYVAYINSNMNIKDTVVVETIVIKNDNVTIEDGSIKFSKDDTFGQSSRSIYAEIPYSVENNKLYTGDATFALNQNIYVEGWLERNTKTEETYIHLRSDYPGLTFNSGMGIVAESSKSYERSMRKNCGIGISIGPNLSMSYDFANKKFVPTVGIGITLGFNYTPKWAQW